MNKIEKVAYKQLLQEGYDKKDIIINVSKKISPDFIIGKREIEIKSTPNNIISFTKDQKNLKNDCEIWVFTKERMYKFTFLDLKNNKTPFKIIFHNEKDMIISRKNWNILWNIKILKDLKTLDDALCEVLTFYEKHNKKENHKH